MCVLGSVVDNTFCNVGVIGEGLKLWMTGKQPAPWSNYLFEPEIKRPSATDDVERRKALRNIIKIHRILPPRWTNCKNSINNWRMTAMNDKALPAWDLSDLYDGIEDEKIAADLEKYRAFCVEFAGGYKGRLSELDGRGSPPR